MKKAMEVIVISLCTALGINEIQKNGIDFWRTWITISSDFTDLVDNMLMRSKRAVIWSKKMNSKNVLIPDVGKHFYYYETNSWLHYITFHKIALNEATDKYKYICYVAPRQKQTFNRAIIDLFVDDPMTVRTMCIDTSTNVAFAIPLYVKCFPPKKKQLIILKTIHEHYTNSISKQFSICITGAKGMGKSSIAKLLKKYMEKIEQDIMIKLFLNFSLFNINCPVERLILSHASKNTPVILLIDEIDVAFKEAVNPNTYRDKTYVRNIETMNKVMDQIADTCYSIVIYTTEKSYSELNCQEYQSFIRPGRIDLFMKLSADDCSIERDMKTEKID